MYQPSEPCFARICDQSVVEAMQGQSSKCGCAREYDLRGHGDLGRWFELSKRYVPDMSIL
jgi:hypothetical protein